MDNNRDLENTNKEEINNELFDDSVKSEMTETVVEEECISDETANINPDAKTEDEGKREFDDTEESELFTRYDFSHRDAGKKIEEQDISPEASSKATSSLVLSIVALALNASCACFPASLVLGIIALVKSRTAKALFPNKKGDGRTTTSFVLSIIAIITSAIAFVSALFIIFVAILTEIFMSGGTQTFIL